MAKRFIPNAPFDVAMKLLIPTTIKVKGVTKKTFPDPATIEEVFFGSFRTYGGTENFSNDIYMVFDTAIIETWYDPRFASDCQIYICETQRLYNIITRPENINMRHQFVQFKVENVGGKA